MQEHAENALKRHLKEDLQPEFDKNNRNLRNFPFTNRISDKVAETLINSGRKNSERYRSLKLQGASNEQIEESFNLEAPMKVFSWEGDIDTVMTPNDSLRYYKGILRAGLISVEPSTGFVKAWVGGIDFNHFAYDHVKQGTRQVGSTIKPFVYATAITMGVVKPCTKFPYGSSACVDVFNNGRITKQWCPKGQLTPSFGTDPSVEWCLTNSNNPGTVLVMSKMGGQAGPKKHFQTVKRFRYYTKT
jgi:penicillin-binding protein 1A